MLGGRDAVISNRNIGKLAETQEVIDLLFWARSSLSFLINLINVQKKTIIYYKRSVDIF